MLFSYACTETQPARGPATPLFYVFTEPIGTTNGGIAGFGLLIAQYSTFSAQINDLWPIRGAARRFSAVAPGLGLRSPTGEDRKRRQLAGRNLSVKSVTGPGRRRKILLEFAFHPLVLLGVGRGFLLLGDVRPTLGIFGIHLEPFFQSGLGVRLDGIGGTFRLAHTAVDALVRMDNQHVVAFVEAVYGADL